MALKSLALVLTLGVTTTACNGLFGPKPDGDAQKAAIDAAVNARLDAEHQKQLESDYAKLKDENDKLKAQVDELTKKLASAEAAARAARVASNAGTAKSGGTGATPAKTREQQMQDLKEQLRGGSGAK